MIRGRRRGGVGRAGILVAVALLAGCQIQERPPAGVTSDDEALGALTTGMYQAMAAADTVALDRGVFGAATVLLATERAAPSLIDWQTASTLPSRRTAGVRVTRTEVRRQGDLASVRAVIVARDAVTAHEFEAADLWTFGRRDSTWRVAHVVFGPWRARTAP